MCKQYLHKTDKIKFPNISMLKTYFYKTCTHNDIHIYNKQFPKTIPLHLNRFLCSQFVLHSVICFPCLCPKHKTQDSMWA